MSRRRERIVAAGYAVLGITAGTGAAGIGGALAHSLS